MSRQHLISYVTTVQCLCLPSLRASSVGVWRSRCSHLAMASSRLRRLLVRLNLLPAKRKGRKKSKVVMQTVNRRSCTIDGARWQYFLLFEGGMKYVWPGTYRRPFSSSPASNTQPYQGAGLHKFEATVREVKNKMLPNPPFMGIKMTVY